MPGLVFRGALRGLSPSLTPSQAWLWGGSLCSPPHRGPKPCLPPRLLEHPGPSAPRGAAGPSVTSCPSWALAIPPWLLAAPQRANGRGEAFAKHRQRFLVHIPGYPSFSAPFSSHLLVSTLSFLFLTVEGKFTALFAAAGEQESAQLGSQQNLCQDRVNICLESLLLLLLRCKTKARCCCQPRRGKVRVGAARAELFVDVSRRMPCWSCCWSQLRAWRGQVRDVGSHWTLLVP